MHAATQGRTLPDGWSADLATAALRGHVEHKRPMGYAVRDSQPPFRARALQAQVQMPRRGGFTRALGPLLLALLAGAASGANLAAACDASVRPALPGVAFQHCAVLRARSGDTPEVRLLWRLHDENATIGVHVDMPLAEIGFVGVGASWNGGMKGAEMWIARVVDGAFTHEVRARSCVSTGGTPLRLSHHRRAASADAARARVVRRRTGPRTTCALCRAARRSAPSRCWATRRSRARVARGRSRGPSGLRTAGCARCSWRARRATSCCGP
jgi:hypothetical protein